MSCSHREVHKDQLGSESFGENRRIVGVFENVDVKSWQVERLTTSKHNIVENQNFQTVWIPRLESLDGKLDAKLDAKLRRRENALKQLVHFPNHSDSGVVVDSCECRFDLVEVFEL